MGASCLARGFDFNRMILLPESEYVGAGGGSPLRIKCISGRCYCCERFASI
ncbi:hypothetical protein V1505DRAFT_379349, partial [Lipomyces doorenjongii]